MTRLSNNSDLSTISYQSNRSGSFKDTFAFLQKGSYHGNNLYQPTLLLAINLVATACHPTFIACSEQGDDYQQVLRFIVQVHYPATFAFCYVGKDVRIKYVSSNFSLHLYHMKQDCFFVFKIVTRKKVHKNKVPEK